MRPEVERAVAAVAGLLRNSEEWRGFFKACCETGAFRLRSQARQFGDELHERDPAGAAFPPADVEGALMLVARRVLPGSAAAQEAAA